MMDVVLPVRDQRELNLRVVSKPDEHVAQLLADLGLELPTAPKMISNVVAKNQRVREKENIQVTYRTGSKKFLIWAVA